MRLKVITWFIVLMILAACSGLPALSNPSEPTPVPTDCGCSAEGPTKLTVEPSNTLSTPVGPVLGGDGSEPQGESLEAYRDRWSTFTNADAPFTFEYPAAYDNPPYQFCAARLDDFPPEGTDFALNLGSRTLLTAAASPAGTDLASAAEAFRTDPRNADFTFEPVQQRSVAGLPALTLPYRSSGTNRYAEVTFFQREAVLYQIETGGPSACDIPDLNLTEMNAYARMLESLQFK